MCSAVLHYILNRRILLSNLQTICVFIDSVIVVHQILVGAGWKTSEKIRTANYNEHSNYEAVTTIRFCLTK